MTSAEEEAEVVITPGLSGSSAISMKLHCFLHRLLNECFTLCINVGMRITCLESPVSTISVFSILIYQ